MSGGPYGPLVLEHFRRPRNRGALASPSVVREATNPLCGDRVRMALSIEGDVVRDARFTADGCALCVASASVLTEMARDLPLGDAAALDEARVLGALEATVPTTRVQCIRLPVTALRDALSAWREGRA